MRSLFLILVLANAWPELPVETLAVAWPSLPASESYPPIVDVDSDPQPPADPDICVDGSCNKPTEVQPVRVRLFRFRR